MSATKPADITLTLQKATEGFTAVMDCPTDNNIIDIRQLLLPVLMKTKYDDLTLTHNLSGVILPSEHYEQIYKKGAYLIPPFNDTQSKVTDRTVAFMNWVMPSASLKSVFVNCVISTALTVWRPEQYLVRWLRILRAAPLM